MHPEGMLTRFGSAHSLFRSDTMQSLRSNKKSESRDPHDLQPVSTTGVGRLRAISRVNWSSVAKGLRAPAKDPSVVKNEFQQKLRINSDTVVAGLELVIVLLSCIQLELSSRSPRWRENRMCERLADCEDMHDEGSFAVVNTVRLTIAAVAIVRLWVRARFLRDQRLLQIRHYSLTRMWILELLGLVLFPYPGLERFLGRNQADTMVLLSVVVGVRTICWRQILYFPYPIRQKEKVASFSGNLEFSYRAFVFKKVMDDRPLTKLVIMSSIMLVLTTFLVRAIETINGVCTLDDAFDATTGEHHHHFYCNSVSWSDSLWLVTTAFVMIGYGDIVPTSGASRLVIVVAACVMRCVIAMLAAVIIKKFHFSSMEARVHAFLFRMDLFHKKDLSAVMAVQASFRFAKSYKRSLMWHKHSRSQLYYRPLSARLPNEVKKKLYIARFQASLKDILKFNTDGDPLNSFTKHIEVITAALGITLIEMAQLKKVYYRKSRLIEERRRQTMIANSEATKAPAPLIILAAQDAAAQPAAPPPRTLSRPSPVSTPRGSARNLLTLASPDTSFSSPRPVQARAPVVPPQFGQSLLEKCNQVLAQLQQIEQDAKNFRTSDR